MKAPQPDWPAARTNPQNDLSRVDWRFLLPRLRFDAILYLGAPSAPEARVLATMAERVVAAAPDPSALDRLKHGVAPLPPGRFITTLADPGRPLPLATQGFDLIVARDAEARRILRSSTGLAELDRLLRPDGCVYLETAGAGDALWLRMRLGRARAHGLTPRVLWPTRRKGALRLALARDDHAAARYCYRHVVAGVSRQGRILRRIASELVRLRVLPYLMPRRILLLERPPADRDSPAPGPYWRAPLEAAGAAFAATRAALYARGDHNKNKVILLLFDGSTRPSIVVKIPRAPDYNGRLEREHQCLVQLHQRRFAPAGTYPEALFLDYHGGLAIHGQTMLGGTAFRNRTTCRPNCPFTADAVEWITRLGEVSAERVGDAGMSDNLRDLNARFHEVYRVPDADAVFLAERLDALARACTSIPRVFQHGDAGTWNIVVSEDDRVGFMDWEDADPAGLPLWDLFHVFHSFATWIARVHGRKDDATTYARSYFEPTPLNKLHTEAIRRYCDRVGVDRTMVEPLFYACWMNRALRAAAGVEGVLEDGAYFRMLRLAIQHRNARGLECMFT